MSANFVSGIVSGLDTAGLIDALVTSRTGPILLMQQRQAEKTQQLSAWKSFEATLVALKVETDGLAKSSLWDTPQVVVGDEEVFTASVSSQAALGSYDLFVESLAQAHQVESTAYSTRSETVGSGTLTIAVGNDSTDLTVAAGTTIEELVDQVNEADLGATASLVRSDDGTAEAYYMVLTSDESGTANQITVTSGLTGGTDPLLTTQTRAASNAVIRLGAEDGLQVESSTNVFDDIFEGVDITVHKKSDAGDPVDTADGTTTSLTVQRDTKGLEDAVAAFVDGYNAVMGFVNSQFSFDPDLGVRQPLLGDGSLSAIASDLRSLITSPLSGATGELTTMFSIGISSGSNGSLTFDRADFQEALDEDFDGVSNLFRANATFDGSGIEWLSAPDDLDLTGLDLEVIVTQAATRAELAGSTFALGAGVVIDDTNDQFRINVDGQLSETLELAHGTYTSHADLAAAIQTAINGSSELGELTVEVSATDAGGGSGNIVIKSKQHGSDHTLTLIQTGTSTFKTDLGLDAVFGTEAAGLDVEGTIGGVVAEGSGQTLRAPEDQDDTAGFGGVSFLVTTDAPTTFAAAFTDGIARSASRSLFSLTDTADGRLTRIGESIQRVIDGFDEDIVRKQEQLDRYRERLARRYARLESTLGQLQSQGAAVSAQFNAGSSGGFGISS